MDFSRCYGCMRELDSPGAVCPQCGYDNTNDPGRQPSHVLPCGSVLNGKFVVGRCLGQGGFGITYIAYNLLLRKTFCIKEYYPRGYAMRSATQSRLVLWGDGADAQYYREKRESFVEEAQRAVQLEALRHVVKVWDVFYENETAYIVMEYIEGESLQHRLKRMQRPFSERECLALLTPVMEDLERAHELGIVHRDIKPDNIMLRANGEAVLLDLGAAKNMGHSAQVGSVQSSSAVVSEGFSPREQYRRNGKIGSWTDVYAMCATIAYLVSGKLPPSPMDRDEGEKFDLSAFSPAAAQVLEKGLALRAEDRIQTMGELLTALNGKKPDPREEEYQRARALQNSDDENALRTALDIFLALGSYRDTAERAEICRKRLEPKPQKPLKLVISIVAGALLLGAGGYYIGTHWINPTQVITPTASPYQVIVEPSTSTPAPSTSTPAPSTPTPIPTPSGEPQSTDITDAGLSYEVFADCVRISGYDKSNQEVVIPAEIEGKPVTSIGDKAFYFCSALTSVKIPDSVTTIGESAFNNCRALTGITIPDSVTSIGDGAFYRCESLTSMMIPASVTSIGKAALCYCSAMTSITVEQKNNSYCAQGNVLYTKDMKTLVAYPAGRGDKSFAIPSSVTTIGRRAFSGCRSLTSVIIPDSVTSIGNSVFSDCDALERINLPFGVTTIGSSVFSGCALESINLPPSVTSIGGGAFYDCSALTSVTIPDNVTSIGKLAFGFCKSLTSVTIPSSVTNIGDEAFFACDALMDVFYAGSEAQWKNIDIDSGNSSLTTAVIHYAK